MRQHFGGTAKSLRLPFHHGKMAPYLSFGTEKPGNGSMPVSGFCDEG